MLGVVVATSVTACGLVIGVLVHEGLAEAGLWAGLIAGLAGVVAAAAAVWVLVPRPSRVPLPPLEMEPPPLETELPLEMELPPEMELPRWVVGRPAELAEVVTALVSGRAGTVGITTGLYGAGGFGKTTLAQMVCAEQQVRQAFRGLVYSVTVGRDVQGAAAISAKVNDVIKLLTDKDATFTDPQLAGQRLGSLLDAGPRRLLVLDDVWEPEQLAPFTEGGKKCTRLVTTRVPELLAGRGVAVRVDQMSPEQAQALLTFGLPQLDRAVVAGLLAVTGRWPLLLRLVNKILADYARVAADVSAQGTVLLDRLRVGGPAVVDDVLGDESRGLDVGKPLERARAVRATIEASTGLLDRHEAERFTELGVFAEDEVIPFSLVARLWRITAGLDDLQAAQVCSRLVQLALVSQATGPTRGMTMHDVVHDFLHAELGQDRLAKLNRMLLDAVAADLPKASPLDTAEGSVLVAWWRLGTEDRYLWNHLIEHLRDAGLPGEADAIATDLRWVGARLERFGLAALAADLSAPGTPRAARLSAVLARAAHLLAPTEPAEAVMDILQSRVADDPDWGPQVTALRDISRRPRLVNRWPLPDLADPALRRVLTGHAGLVGAVAVAPDGSWLASGGMDGKVRIWDAVTGQQRAAMVGGGAAVVAVAVAPDGSWLASGDWDGVVRIWDVATGQQRAALTCHPDAVTAVAVAPDGSWLATGSGLGLTVRIWDVATGRQRGALTGQAGGIPAVVVAPDGSWLATGGMAGAVGIWDAVTGQKRAQVTGMHGAVTVAIAPDGSWLATGGIDGVRIWDLATRQLRADLAGQTSQVRAVAVAPDGSWLATASGDQSVRIWDAVTGRQRAVMTGHTGLVTAMAVAPDGSWLATASADQTVRIWDTATGQQGDAQADRTDAVTAVAVAPDGNWLATGGRDGAVRIWDVATGQQRADLTRQTSEVRTVAVAPDGSWLATSGVDAVRIWDVATGRQRGALTGQAGGIAAVAVAPDGSWLASGGRDGVVRIWDVATGRQRAAMTGHTGLVMTVAVAPDGSWLASGGGDRMVRIWDPATGRLLTAGRHTKAVTALAVAPDSRCLAFGNEDGGVRIWDVFTGQERAVQSGHTGMVTAVAVAPDGRWLATGSTDRTVRIWDVASGRPQALMRLDNGVNASAWLGGSALVVGGSSGLYLFDFLTSTSAVANLDQDGRTHGSAMR